MDKNDTRKKPPIINRFMNAMLASMQFHVNRPRAAPILKNSFIKIESPIAPRCARAQTTVDF